AASGGCKALKEGVLEKRSDGLLQLWKKKSAAAAAAGLETPAKLKELHFSNMKTVDCVERKGKYMYFTVVMAEGKEIDFRCPQDQGWNAEITLQMVQYKNRQAILAVNWHGAVAWGTIVGERARGWSKKNRELRFFRAVIQCHSLLSRLN
uniref:Pleckstrin homology like domain family A member 1 n=1 Tax=Vombatus ursinus TaxID=29139 RepID=A0A4X2JT05_VOMUR